MIKTLKRILLDSRWNDLMNLMDLLKASENSVHTKILAVYSTSTATPNIARMILRIVFLFYADLYSKN